MSSEKPSFWSTLPGILTAVAGVISAIAVLITAFVGLMGALPKPASTPAPTDGPGASVAAATASRSASPVPTPTASSTSRPSRPIVFYSQRPDSTGTQRVELWSIDPATRHETQLTSDSAPDSDPALSPDGSRIAFDSRRLDGKRDIWIREPDRTFTRLTDDVASDALPVWSPDGSRIAWAKGTAGSRSIWVMSSTTGGGAHPLTKGADDLSPAWSPNGLIAFQRRVGSAWEVWAVDPSGGTPKRLIAAAQGGGNQPAWSPDGRLAFVRSVGGVDRIFVVSADGSSGLVAFPDGLSCPCDRPAWAPDGSAIAYMGPGSGVVRPIMVFDLGGGPARTLTTNGLDPFWAG